MMTRYGWLAMCLTAVVVGGLANTAMAQDTAVKPMTPTEMLAAAAANVRDPGSRVADAAEPVPPDLIDALLPFDRDETPIVQLLGVTLIDTLFGWINDTLANLFAGLNLTDLLNSILGALRPGPGA